MIFRWLIVLHFLRCNEDRRTLYADLNRSAFHYDANYDYTLHPSVVIGKIDKLCVYCSAFKFKNETPRMCTWAEKWNCRNYIHHTNQYQLWYQVSQAYQSISWQTYANTITCQYSKCKGKFIIVLDHYYYYRTQITNLFHWKHWCTNW